METGNAMTHPIAWLIWLAAATICTWNSRNPFVLVLLLLALIIVRFAHPQREHALFSPMRAALLVPISAILNALWTRAGDTVLLRLPESIPLLGGAVTLEAITYGALNGMALLGLFLAFAIVQQALPLTSAIALIPRALHPITVVLVIAVTYLPLAQRQARAVRDAQAVRGHTVRSLRDWQPLLMPMLAGALEHALQLAEAMSARGYGRSRNMSSTPQFLLIAGIFAVLAGWLLRTITHQSLLGWVAIAGGLALISAALWQLRVAAPRTTFKATRLQVADIYGIFGSLTALIAVLAPLPGKDMFVWTPYPTMHWPAFAPLIGVLLCGLCTPALLTRFIDNRDKTNQTDQDAQ